MNLYLHEYVIICKEEIVTKHIFFERKVVFVSKNNAPNSSHWVKLVFKKML